MQDTTVHDRTIRPIGEDVIYEQCNVNRIQDLYCLKNYTILVDRQKRYMKYVKSDRGYTNPLSDKNFSFTAKNIVRCAIYYKKNTLYFNEYIFLVAKSMKNKND